MAQNLPFSIAMRLIFIDHRLGENRWGELNRKDLVGAFGVTRKQAGDDINLYKAKWPNRIKYNHSRKTYVGQGECIFSSATRGAVLAVILAVQTNEKHFRKLKD